jgi:hypothetical protein
MRLYIRKAEQIANHTAVEFNKCVNGSSVPEARYQLILLLKVLKSIKFQTVQMAMRMTYFGTLTMIRSTHTAITAAVKLTNNFTCGTVFLQSVVSQAIMHASRNFWSRISYTNIIYQTFIIIISFVQIPSLECYKKFKCTFHQGHGVYG